MKPHRDSVSYWKKQTSDAQSSSVPKQDVYLRYLDLLEIRPGMKVLDLCVGFGRFIDDYVRLGAEPYGVDIDPEMLASARAEHGQKCRELKVAGAEETGYPDGFFDRIVCWAAFDELDQTRALVEISRLLTPGGRALLTGKNTYYEPDDTEALAAEEGCRRKNHPNHFTRYDEIDLPSFGLEPVREHFFRRRGDFAAARFITDKPERFYEFAVVLSKTGPVTVSPTMHIADTHSRTWREIREHRT